MGGQWLLRERRSVSPRDQSKVIILDIFTYEQLNGLNKLYTHEFNDNNLKKS